MEITGEFVDLFSLRNCSIYAMATCRSDNPYSCSCDDYCDCDDSGYSPCGDCSCDDSSNSCPCED